jgi:hypothetical protein
LSFGLAGPTNAAAPCDKFSARLPYVNRAFCEAAKLQPSAARSVTGRTRWTRDIKAELAPADTPQAVHGRFIPALKLDGLLSQPARRVNPNGVDLNRNFPIPNSQRNAKTFWEKRTNKDPRRYPGITPLSKPESKFIYEEMQRFKPHLIVSIHAALRRTGLRRPTRTPLDVEMRQIWLELMRWVSERASERVAPTGPQQSNP